MILQIAKLKKGQSGFSLIEVVLSVIVLSVGLIAVNQTLLFALSSLNYADIRMQADQLAEEKIWEVQSTARHSAQKPPVREEGEILGSDRAFNYILQSVAVRGSSYLYESRLSLEWRDSGKKNKIVRHFYASLPIAA